MCTRIIVANSRRNNNNEGTPPISTNHAFFFIYTASFLPRGPARPTNPLARTTSQIERLVLIVLKHIANFWNSALHLMGRGRDILKFTTAVRAGVKGGKADATERYRRA